MRNAKIRIRSSIFMCCSTESSHVELVDDTGNVELAPHLRAFIERYVEENQEEIYFLGPLRGKLGLSDEAAEIKISGKILSLRWVDYDEAKIKRKILVQWLQDTAD